MAAAVSSQHFYLSSRIEGAFRYEVVFWLL